MVKKKKVKTRRSQAKYPALDPELNLLTRYEEIEDLASYAHSLSEEDKEWLNQFAEEYICAKFTDDDSRLHKTKEQELEIYNKNNARNRCIYTREKAQDCLNWVEDYKNDSSVAENSIHDESNIFGKDPEDVMLLKDTVKRTDAEKRSLSKDRKTKKS